LLERKDRSMKQANPAWLDAQYNARAAIPEHARIFERWATDSRAARERLAGRIDLRYGDGPNETLDVFAPPGAAGAPVFVFIHGGYWRALDKSDQSFLAPPFVDAGVVVVLPNYALCPAVGIATIAM
jgi:arylformamidase